MILFIINQSFGTSQKIEFDCSTDRCIFLDFNNYNCSVTKELKLFQNLLLNSAKESFTFPETLDYYFCWDFEFSNSSSSYSYSFNIKDQKIINETLFIDDKAVLDRGTHPIANTTLLLSRSAQLNVPLADKALQLIDKFTILSEDDYRGDLLTILNNRNSFKYKNLVIKTMNDLGFAGIVDIVLFPDTTYVVYSLFNQSPVYVPIADESNGTIKMINILFGIFEAMDCDRYLVISNFDRNLHPVLFEKVRSELPTKKVLNQHLETIQYLT